MVVFQQHRLEDDVRIDTIAPWEGWEQIILAPWLAEKGCRRSEAGRAKQSRTAATRVAKVSAEEDADGCNR